MRASPFLGFCIDHHEMRGNRIRREADRLLKSRLQMLLQIRKYLKTTHRKYMWRRIGGVQLSCLAQTSEGSLDVVLRLYHLRLGGTVGSFRSPCLRDHVKQMGSANEREIDGAWFGRAKVVDRSRTNRWCDHVERKITILPILALTILPKKLPKSIDFSLRSLLLEQIEFAKIETVTDRSRGGSQA